MVFLLCAFLNNVSQGYAFELQHKNTECIYKASLQCDSVDVQQDLPLHGWRMNTENICKAFLLSAFLDVQEDYLVELQQMNTWSI